MKKILPIFLLVLFTVFAVLSCNTSYQNLSLQHRSYSIKKTEQKESSLLIVGLTKYPELVQQATETTIELVKNQSCDKIFGSSHPGYKFKMNSIVPDEVFVKETNAVDWISGCPAHNFFDDPISGKNKKGDDMIVNQVGGAGIVLVRLYFEFTKFSGKKLAKSHTISVSQKTGG